jgi:uncharacterized protein
MVSNANKLQVAVVTGGHAFDIVNFHHLFQSLPGVEPIIQHMDDFASSPETVRDQYDVVVLYHYLQENPTDEGLPWYAGKPKTAMAHLGESGQGIVVLHHTVLAYPDWDLWPELVGIADRDFSYHNDQQFQVEVANPHHPITAGLQPWSMVDETYKMAGAGADSEILLTTSHPNSMPTLAWTRQYKNSRVFCCPLGHDNSAWKDENFRTLLSRGIAWSASRIG